MAIPFGATAFAKLSILNTPSADFPDIFYFEIRIKKVKRLITFGLAIKEQAPLDGTIRIRNGTYAYEGDSDLWINGSSKSGNERFGNGDVVGIGVILASKQLFFTKNGQRTGLTNLSICSSPDQLFPFVTLWDSDDKIDTNFGPDFTFSLATL